MGPQYERYHIFTFPKYNNPYLFMKNYVPKIKNSQFLVERLVPPAILFLLYRPSQLYH